MVLLVCVCRVSSGWGGNRLCDMRGFQSSAEVPKSNQVQTELSHSPDKARVFGLTVLQVGQREKWVWVNINHQGTAYFSSYFRLPGLNFGHPFLTHSQIEEGLLERFMQGAEFQKELKDRAVLRARVRSLSAHCSCLAVGTN